MENELEGTCSQARSPWELVGTGPPQGDGVRDCQGEEEGLGWGSGELGGFTGLTLQLQAPGEIPTGDPGLQGQQLLGGVLQEVGDVGLDEAKTAGEGLGAGEGDVTTALPPSPQAKGLPCPVTPSDRAQPGLDLRGRVWPLLPLVAREKHP